ncbi:hypothetical protein ACGCUP_01055 [Eubacteriales bacterium KG125]
MRKIGTYKMTPARLVFRDYLDQLTLYDIADIVGQHPKLREYLEKFSADFLARNMTEVDVKNIIAEEIGAKEYHKRLELHK